uniref:Uncharacterized protein n=1 Tax=Helianthus annuus TaxID=4232 RepID=A0A251RYF5_HELAN
MFSDSSDNPKSRLSREMFSDSVIPYIQTNPGCQEWDLSSPMVPLLATERRS